MVRLLLAKSSREHLFEYLKEKYNINTYIDLSKKLNVSYSALKKWRLGYRYIPQKIVPNEKMSQLDILKQEPDNWGVKKGGQKGIKYTKSSHQKKSEWGRKGGKIAINKLRNWCENNSEAFSTAIRKGWILKRLKQIDKQTRDNDNFFKPKEILFNLSLVEFSKKDKSRNIVLPAKLTPDLAEEIGIHTGDGTLPIKKYYFSVRGDLKERDYCIDYLSKLYSKLYNINPKPLVRGPICGFEISSKAIYTFKNKVIGLPIGEKVQRIDVPPCIIESHDRKIICRYLKGIFDTDGCVYHVKRYKDKKTAHPRIQIQIRSEKLMKNLKYLLELLGFDACLNKKDKLAVNGIAMFYKWLNEIGSSNTKHLKRIDYIKSILGPWGSQDNLDPCGGSDSCSNHDGPV